MLVREAVNKGRAAVGSLGLHASVVVLLGTRTHTSHCPLSLGLVLSLPFAGASLCTHDQPGSAVCHR